MSLHENAQDTTLAHMKRLVSRLPPHIQGRGCVMDGTEEDIVEYKVLAQLTVRQLEEHTEILKCLSKDVKQLQIDFAAIKVKSGMIGTLAGLIGGVLAGLVAWLKMK